MNIKSVIKNIFAVLKKRNRNNECKEIDTLRRRNKALQNALFDLYVQLVMKETRWDRASAKAKLKDAKKRTGCSYKEYLKFKLYKLTNEEQNRVCFFLHEQTFEKKIRCG